MSQVVRPKKVLKGAYLLGLIFLFLNKIRYGLFGYSQPRGFISDEIKRAVEYDWLVVEGWLKNCPNIKNKSVLELGPGPDLGIGLILLALGAKDYVAIDANNLLKLTSLKFYEELFVFLRKKIGGDLAEEKLRLELKLALAGRGEKLKYYHNKSFDLAVLGKTRFDVVFSQAAFEHFSNITNLVSQLSNVVEPSGKLVAEIDLQTHSRYLRDKDPLNIYRYSEGLYNSLKFFGAPNRLRPWQYEDILKRNNWTNIQIKPLNLLDENHLKIVKVNLSKTFQDSVNKMNYLSLVLVASKK